MNDPFDVEFSNLCGLTGASHSLLPVKRKNFWKTRGCNLADICVEPGRVLACLLEEVSLLSVSGSSQEVHCQAYAVNSKV